MMNMNLFISYINCKHTDIIMNSPFILHMYWLISELLQYLLHAQTTAHKVPVSDETSSSTCLAQINSAALQ